MDLSEGFPFSTRDIWRPSGLEIEEDRSALFPKLNTDFLPLKLDETEKASIEHFQLPDFPPLGGVDGQHLEKVDSEGPSGGIHATQDVPSLASQSADDLPDVWTLDLTRSGQENESRLRTWEAFEKRQSDTSKGRGYLSEAGPQASDVALSHTPTRQHVGEGVLPQDVMLRALSHLVLGRSSIFFQWDETKERFTSTLPNVPISGNSRLCCDSYWQRVIEFGSSQRNLRTYCSQQKVSKRACNAAIAFKGCVNGVLNSVERQVTAGIAQVRSLLQLQRLIEAPHRLLSLLSTLVECVHGCRTDEDFISRLSIEVDGILRTGSCFNHVLQTILFRTSGPWIEQLCSDLGFRKDAPSQHVQENNQRHSEFVSPELDLTSDAAGEQRLPTFVLEEDQALIRETRASVRILRQHMPHVDFSGRIPVDLRDAQSGGVANIQKHELPSEARATDTELLPWADDSTQHKFLAALDDRMSRPLETPTNVADEMEDVVTRSFSHPKQQNLLENCEFTPLERIRPLLQMHNCRINQAILQHLFFDCRLRSHLDLQKDFHLLGNGDFVERLTTSLFSSETQSAERRRGTIPTGENMGLRLDSREGQRWPPASSELRLTLMGVLTEAYHQEKDTSGEKELPGGLSFSIRELPDEEIDMVMDAGSIYALDFLRLQYTARAPLDTVLTEASMKSYDAIFRHLLRLLRMLHVVTTLRRRLVFQGNESASTSNRRFVAEAYQFVTALTSHSMDVGIAAPWHALHLSLEDVEKALKSERDEDDGLPGLEGVRKLHLDCLETIRTRLFLRRRQEKLNRSIEDTFASILASAAIIDKERASSEEHEAGISRFQRSVRTTLKLLRNDAKKPAKFTVLQDKVDDSADTVRLLLTKLDWNDYYGDET